MAQQVKALTTKPEDPNSIPKSHVTEGDPTSKSGFLTATVCTQTRVHVRANTCTHYINVKNSKIK